MSSTAPHPHRLARAFLALADDVAPEPVKRSAVMLPAATLAVLALALAAPLSWLAPPRSSQKVTDQPAATLASSKAAFHPADDEDDDGG